MKGGFVRQKPSKSVDKASGVAVFISLCARIKITAVSSPSLIPSNFLKCAKEVTVNLLKEFYSISILYAIILGIVALLISFVFVTHIYI